MNEFPFLTFDENGSVTDPAGFKASGITCGLKKSGNKDAALVYSELPANFAAAFTSCTFAAAPVVYDRKLAAESETIRAIFVNSGIANACTGSEGIANAARTAAAIEEKLNLPPRTVMVESTGRIGVHLPMEKILKGVDLACSALAGDGGLDAAAAIMTTDTVSKHLSVKVDFGNGYGCTIGAITKGVGMIDPNMVTVPHATMLCTVTTDAKIDNGLLSEMLSRCVDKSFNRITVDGDMSTNDTVVIMANGAAGIAVHSGSDTARRFEAALLQIMQKLAKKQVMDGEGATKFVAVEVRNAPSVKDARLCAEAVANSLLCKTAWFGCDPNWGRIVAALGYSTAQFDPELTDVYYNDKAVVKGGRDAGTPETELAEILAGREFTVKIDLHDKSGDSYWVWTSDISYEYVKINAEYHT